MSREPYIITFAWLADRKKWLADMADEFGRQAIRDSKSNFAEWAGYYARLAARYADLLLMEQSLDGMNAEHDPEVARSETRFSAGWSFR